MTGGHAVAALSRQPIGIGIRMINPARRDEDMELFTETEKKLMEGLPRPEGAARFLTAKEAFLKKQRQTGGANPDACHVTGADETTVIIGTQRIRTMKIDGDLITGWTLD